MNSAKTTSHQQTKSEDKSFVSMKGLKYCYHASGSQKKCFKIGSLDIIIKQGELISLLGPSGSGKTTFLRLLAGLERSHEGRIVVDDEVLLDKHNYVRPENRQIGMMFQDHALFPHLRVKQNILFGIRHLSKHDRERRLYELESLLKLEGYLDRFPHELSGGQQQRVALARTLAPKPKVILLDEPLSSIDAELRGSLAQELRDVLKETQSTALWVTHDQGEALDLADRVLVMNKGRIEQIDTPWNLYNNPKTRFVADFIGHAVFINGTRKENSIVTEVGTVDSLPCLSQYKDLELMLRPDDVEATPFDEGIGVVSKRQFLGAIQLYSISLPSGQSILTYQQPQINWPIGTHVRIVLKPKNIVAFPV
ncbi:MAG: iron(III) transport system ATP-binding protein [Lysobacterales bacterium]|jgi:iron(III) transport system ATP-binding protein